MWPHASGKDLDSCVVKVYEKLAGVTCARPKPAPSAEEAAKQEPKEEIEVFDEDSHKLVLRNEYCNALIYDFTPGFSPAPKHFDDSLTPPSKSTGEKQQGEEVHEETVFDSHKAE